MLRAVAKPSDAVYVVANSAVAIPCPADTSEDILATITLPPLRANTEIRVFTRWSCTNSANNKTFRIRLGGAAGTAFLNTSQTAIQNWLALTLITNRGATNSQVGALGSGLMGAGGSAFVTGSIDTSVSTTLVITGQKASAGETLTLEAYSVELVG